MWVHEILGHGLDFAIPQAVYTTVSTPPVESDATYRMIRCVVVVVGRFSIPPHVEFTTI